MPSDSTLMRAEIEEIPEVAERLLSRGDAAVAEALTAIGADLPPFFATVARGSSDHMCTYFKYVSEILLGVPVASLGPSVASIYGAPLRISPGVCLAVSQSGESPDIVAMARLARRQGAATIAITNSPASPLAEAAGVTLDIHAGVERSVAATKTFVASTVTGLMLLARLSGNGELIAALKALPGALERACRLDWPELRASLGDSTSLFTLGRGPGWAISNEAALKFKETCQIHGQSFSSAEVLHGPVSMIAGGFPVLAFAAADKAERAVVEVAEHLAGKGARVFVTSGAARRAKPLDHVRSGHPLTDPLCLITSFYAMVERMAVTRGIDPDRPPHLSKITQTR